VLDLTAILHLVFSPCPRFLLGVPVLPLPVILPALVQQSTPLIKPIWITALPQQPGRVYAMGLVAVTGADAVALKQASDAARAEVITRLRASVKSDTQTSTRYQESRTTGGPASASRSQSARIDTQIQSRATDLPGLVLEETYIDRSSRTAYALAYLDVPVAERELRTRFGAQQEALAGAPGGLDVRSRLRRIQALRGAQLEYGKLDDMAGLLSAGGSDPALRSDVRKAKLDLDNQLDALRASVTVGIIADPGLDLDVKGLLRNAVLQEGLGWSDRKPELTLQVRMKTGKSRVDIGKKSWYNTNSEGDFVVSRGALTLTLVDALGQEYESTIIEAKGVGTSDMQAEQALLKDFKSRLTKAVDAWLAELVR